MYLDQVVRGIGTSNQTTMRIGQFSAQGAGYTTWQWSPLTDAGLVAPAVVKLNGTNTLRLTTAGNANPNFIMLVPTSGIRLNVGRSGGNTVISFNAQPDVIYRVFYRTNLTAGTWTLLTSVVGNGGTKSVTDPATGAGRFYKVQAP